MWTFQEKQNHTDAYFNFTEIWNNGCYQKAISWFVQCKSYLKAYIHLKVNLKPYSHSLLADFTCLQVISIRSDACTRVGGILKFGFGWEMLLGIWKGPIHYQFFPENQKKLTINVKINPILGHILTKKPCAKILSQFCKFWKVGPYISKFLHYTRGHCYYWEAASVNCVQHIPILSAPLPGLTISAKNVFVRVLWSLLYTVNLYFIVQLDNYILIP